MEMTDDAGAHRRDIRRLRHHRRGDRAGQRAVEAGASSLWVAEHLGYREAIATCVAFALKAPGPDARPDRGEPLSVASDADRHGDGDARRGRAGTRGDRDRHPAIRCSCRNPGRAWRSRSAPCASSPKRCASCGPAKPSHLDGEFVKLAGARLAFKPSAPIPIYIAAMGPDMLRLAGRIADGVALSAGLSTDSVRQSLALCAEGAAKAGRDPATLRRAGYMFFGASHDSREAIDAVRQKLAFVMRNKFLGANIRDSGIPIDQEAVIAAIARRDIAGAAALVPDEAVEAFGIAGTPSIAPSGCATSSMPGSTSPCSACSAAPKTVCSRSTSCESSWHSSCWSASQRRGRDQTGAPRSTSCRRDVTLRC